MLHDIYRPRLRILLDPVYVSVSNLSGSSTYHRMLALIREMIKRGHFIYWMVPDREEYQHDPLEDHPQVEIVRTTPIHDQFLADGLIADNFFNLFNRTAGQFHIDVLCTNRNSTAAGWKRALEPARFHDNKTGFTDKGYGLPVVILEEFPQTPDKQHTSESYFLSQCLGYLASDRTMFLSAHNREAVTREMLKIFVSSRIEEFTQRQAKAIPPGINCDELDKIYDPERWKAEAGFKIVSIGRLFSGSYIEHIPWFDYIFKSGISDAQLTLSLSGSLGGPMRGKLSKIGFDFANVGRQFQIITDNHRENFIRQLRSYHAFICPLIHHDYPMGVCEAMYMGIPGIIPVSDYQQSFFKEYPFVIDPRSKEEFIGTLLWIRDNKEEARERVLPWRDIMREKFNTKINIPLWVNEIETVAREHVNRFKTSGAVINFCKELKGKSYTFSDVVAFLQKSGHTGVSIGNMKVRGTFTYGRSSIHHSMHMAGYVDTCRTAEEIFVRRDVFDRG